VSDKELIDAYFNHPKVIVKLNLELGFDGRVEVNWDKGEVWAHGPKGGKCWKLDEILPILRQSEFNQAKG